MCIYVFGRVFDLFVYLCVLSSYSAYSVFVSQVFLRFTSLCGVFPLNLVRGIVRSLLVLSTFVLGGGGGSVTIGQCMSMYGPQCYSVIVHSRWSEVA